VRRLQGSAGQTNVEWLAVMACVVAIVVGVITTIPKVGTSIVATARAAVCKVGGMSCGGSGQGNGLDPNAPTSGPAIGAHPRNVGAGLPFPGSVSVTIDPSKSGSTNDDPDDKGPKAGYKVGVSAKFERSTSPCSIDGTGTPTVTLATTADIKVTAGVNGEAKGVGASITGSVGNTTSYNIKTDPGTADKIENHDVPPPNPADPRSIPPGSSIILNKDAYKGVDGGVTYHNITAELGYKDGRRVSSAVQRIDDSTVRVTVGDTDFIENTLGVKVGTDDVNAGISIGNGFQDGKARSVDLDISTPEGWQAYQNFIGAGTLPAQDAPGTSNPTTSTSDVSTHTDTITGKLGPLGGTAGGTTVVGQIVETKHPDGSSETTAFSRRGDAVVATEYDRDPSGKIVGQHYALQLENVDHYYVDGYQQLTGHSGESGSNRDLTLSYSAADLDAMQRYAADQILAAQRGKGGPFSDGGTPEQLKAYLSEHPGAEGLAPAGGVTGQFILAAMAGAKEPSDVLVALMNSGLGSSTGVVDFLMHFYYGELKARHDLGSNDKSSPLPGGYANRPKGC
jgi:hypothetical protein